MNENNEIKQILELVKTQHEFVSFIPNMQRDIAVISTKLETQEKRLSTMPTDTEVTLMFSEHITACEKEKSKRRFSWPVAVALITAILAAAATILTGCFKFFE